MIDWKAKPKQNDVANARVIKATFFIVCQSIFDKFISCRMFQVSTAARLDA
jgi:hypothetical protein